MDRPTEPATPSSSNPPPKKPWPLTVARKRPLAFIALLSLVLLHAILLVLPFVFPGYNFTWIQWTQIGMVSFWLAAGVSPLAIRLIVTTALLAYLANLNPMPFLDLEFWVIILVIPACISAGVGLIARFAFVLIERWQFRLRELLLTVTFCAVALVIMQNISYQSTRFTGLPQFAWHLSLIEGIFNGVLTGLCCVVVLAQREARLWTFGVVIFLLSATLALEFGVISNYQYQLSSGNFGSNFKYSWGQALQTNAIAFLLIWITLFPADYALNLFHRPPPTNPAPDA